MDNIKIFSPSELYEHVELLMPNAYFVEKYEEGDSDTMTLRIKKHATYTETDAQGREYTQEATHDVESTANRLLEEYLEGGWDGEVTGRGIGVDGELELHLIPPEDFVGNN